MKTIIFSCSLVLMSFASLSAQESINSGHNNIFGSGGSVANTIGQTFYETLNSSSGSVIMGIQQAYEITEVLGASVTEINLSLNIYPNPTTDTLYLKIGFGDYKKYRYELSDQSGKKVTSKTIGEQQVSIPMTSYPSALYYLKVIKGDKVVKIFKVLKTNK